MKKISIIIFFAFFFFSCVAGSRFARQLSTSAKAATPSPTKGPDSQINDLKERIASRVAQLKLVQRRGIIGTVTDASGTQLTISDVHEKDRFVDVDELTKFSSPSAKESFGISDITKGTTLGILGLHNRQSERMLGRFVDVLVLPTIIHGAAGAIDENNFTITVATEKNEYTVDIETSTKTLTYNKETDTVERSGFSKIAEGDRVTVVGYASKTEKNRISALRVLRLPGIPKNPMIKTIEQKPSTPSATQKSTQQ